MKKTLVIALAVCLCSLFAAAPAQTRAIRLQLPEPVAVGSIVLPAGECTISETNQSGSASLISIRSEAGPAAMILMERHSSAAGEAAAPVGVVLRQNGGKYEFERISFGGHSYQPLQ